MLHLRGALAPCLPLCRLPWLFDALPPSSTIPLREKNISSRVTLLPPLSLVTSGICVHFSLPRCPFLQSLSDLIGFWDIETDPMQKARSTPLESMELFWLHLYSCNIWEYPQQNKTKRPNVYVDSPLNLPGAGSHVRTQTDRTNQSAFQAGIRYIVK